MKTIKAISAALLSLMTISGVHAQQVQKKKVVTTTETKTTPAISNTKTEVVVKKDYSGQRPHYYYDKSTGKYYQVTNGKRVYHIETKTQTR